MKRTKILYWVFTGLFSALMLFTAIPDIILVPETVAFMTMLGYPAYFTPFIGVAKVLGAIAILIPGFPRIKEWAYAGLVFDLIGASYSLLAIGTPVYHLWFLFIALGLGAASYIFHHKKMKFSKENIAL